jgi:uncharacterized protein involved in exopolysaccharide biosynthesis
LATWWRRASGAIYHDPLSPPAVSTQKEESKVTPLLTTEATSSVPPPEAPTAFADIVTAFFRNKRKIAIAVVVFILLLSGIFSLRSKRYESRMLFLVRDEASTLAITSFDDHPQAQPDPTTTDTQIGTEIELLSGMELHRQVISATHPGLSSKEMDRRLLAFNENLTVLPVPKTTLISVTYSAPSKEEADATLAILSRSYLAYRAGIRGSDGAYTFFDQQANRYYRELQQDQAALAAFDQANQVTLMGEEKNVIVHKLSDARSALYENQASVGETEKRVQTMVSAQATLPSRVTTQRRDLPDQLTAERLNSVLVDLQNKRVELITKYNPTDRHVQEVDDQIANTLAAVHRAQQSKSTEEQSDLNPIRQAVETDLERLKFQSAGLQARQRSLATQVNDYEGKLQQLNELTAQYDDLTRKVSEDESGYDLYFKRREEARINRTLDSDKIANVRRVSGPAIVPQSRGLVVLSIASICIIGVLLIMGAGILAGLWSHSFYSPWELENALGSPVLATIPRMTEKRQSHALAKTTGLASLTLNLMPSVGTTEFPEPLTDGLPPQSLSFPPISRYVGGIDEDCFEAGGAYLPLIEKLRKIDPLDAGGGTVFTFTACTGGEGVSHFVRHLGVELTNYTGKTVAIVNAPDTYESAMASDESAPADLSRPARSGESFLKQWFKRLRETHDYVLIDCPSLSTSRAATIFGPQSDGLLLVVGSGQATRIQLRGSLAMLSLASVRVIGLALNKRSYPVPDVIYNLL